MAIRSWIKQRGRMIISDQRCCLDTAFLNKIINLYLGWVLLGLESHNGCSCLVTIQIWWKIHHANSLSFFNYWNTDEQCWVFRYVSAMKLRNKLFFLEPFFGCFHALKIICSCLFSYIQPLPSSASFLMILGILDFQHPSHNRVSPEYFSSLCKVFFFFIMWCISRSEVAQMDLQGQLISQFSL